MIPIDILLKEIDKIYKMKQQGLIIYDRVRQEIRETSIEIWQRKWDSDQYGRWTFKLIPSIKKWLERKHGNVDYYLSQFLGGHGCFRKFLCRIGVELSPVCLFCGDADEDAEHIFFHCKRFTRLRNDLNCELKLDISATNIVETMVESIGHWNHVSNTVFMMLKFIERF